MKKGILIMYIICTLYAINLIMGFEKLTYSGTECNNYVYFAFDADYFDVKQVTDRLKIEPTSVMLKKDPRPKKTSWSYKIVAGNKIDMRDEISELVELFYPLIPEIIELKHELILRTRLQFVLDIDIDPDASTPCFAFDEKTSIFIGQTKTMVDFDLYLSLIHI